MYKISLVGSYNLADGYLGAARSLERMGCEVSFVPASFYRSEFSKEHVRKIIVDLNKQKPDVVLWWRAETLNANEFAYIRKEIKDTKFILFSWDDPHQWEKHLEMPVKCKVLDAAFSCCMDSVKNYSKFGCKSFYCPPGFDKEIHFPEEDDAYKCDVSIVCTNYYHGDSLTSMPHLSRKDLLTAIIENLDGIDLRIYGPESLRNGFENYYKGWINFEDSHKVFYNSKINLCTHIRPDGDMYINERVTQVLGSGGLLLIDPVCGLDKVLNVNNECVVMDLEIPNISIESINQMKYILNNYKEYSSIKENGYKKALASLSWDSWAKIVMDGIGGIK